MCSTTELLGLIFQKAGSTLNTFLFPNSSFFISRKRQIEKPKIYIPEYKPTNKKMTNTILLGEARVLLEQGKSPLEVKKMLLHHPNSRQDQIDKTVEEALHLCEQAGTLPPKKPQKIVVPVKRGVAPSEVTTEEPKKIIPATPVIVREDTTGNGYITSASSLGRDDGTTTFEEIDKGKEKKKRDFFTPLLYGFGAIGLGAIIYTSFSSFSRPNSEPERPLQTIQSLPSPLEIKLKEEEKIIPVVNEEKQILKYDGTTVTIDPIPGYGLTTYAALLAEQDIKDIAALSWDEQKELLKKQRTKLAKASKADLREILAITTQITEANPRDVYKKALTLEGLKDATKNIIYMHVPLKLSYTAQEKVSTRASERTFPILEEKIFVYNERESETLLDDKLAINFTLPGIGVSQYVTALVEEGWTQETIYELAQWDAKKQKQRVKKAHTRHIQSIGQNAMDPILEITKDIIQDPMNSSEVHKIDVTEKGLKNPKRNVVYLTTFLLLDPAKEDIIQNSLEEMLRNSYEQTNIPDLGALLQDYFDLRAIERDIPIVENPELMSELTKNIARQYNTSQAEGISENLLSKDFSRENRLELARDLYREAADRRQRDRYMTVEDILDFVNEGLDERITARGIREAAQETRTGLLQKQRKDRMQEIYGKFLERDLHQSKKDFYGTIGKEYDISPSTVYKDIRKAEGGEKTRIVYDAKEDFKILSPSTVYLQNIRKAEEMEKPKLVYDSREDFKLIYNLPKEKEN